MPSPATPLPTAVAFASFTDILTRSGARAALAFLLDLSDYRFIGIFRFHDGRANAAIHYDRENPATLQAQEVPDTATYCCIVRDTHGRFATVDSLTDERLVDHPARKEVRAYCGIPILDPDGGLLGTLCHYDVVPRDPTQLDLELLLQVASALQQGRYLPPYPTP